MQANGFGTSVLISTSIAFMLLGSAAKGWRPFLETIGLSDGDGVRGKNESA